jgi:hypothetical protein
VLDSVAVGDRIGVEAASSVVLTYLESPVEYRLQGPSRVAVETKGLVANLGNEPELRELDSPGEGFRIRPIDVAQASVVMRSAPGTNRRLRLLALRSGATAQVTPTFRWDGPEGPYRFELVDASGRTVHRAEVDESTYALPAVQRLAPGASYSWRVGPKSRSETRLPA